MTIREFIEKYKNIDEIISDIDIRNEIIREKNDQLQGQINQSGYLKDKSKNTLIAGLTSLGTLGGLGISTLVSSSTPIIIATTCFGGIISWFVSYVGVENFNNRIKNNKNSAITMIRENEEEIKKNINAIEKIKEKSKKMIVTEKLFKGLNIDDIMNQLLPVNEDVLSFYLDKDMSLDSILYLAFQDELPTNYKDLLPYQIVGIRKKAQLIDQKVSFYRENNFQNQTENQQRIRHRRSLRNLEMDNQINEETIQNHHR